MEFETIHNLPLQPESTIRGISTNPKCILDASDVVGIDATLIHNDTDFQLEYMNGCALQSTGPQKQIASTDWYPSGIFSDHMTLTLNYTTNNITGIELEENSRIFIGKIFKRHPKTHVLISTTEINFLHQQKICNTIGITPKNVQNNHLSDAILYFDSQYEYRLEIYTESQLSTTQSVILDYIQLNHVDGTNYSNSCPDYNITDNVSIIESNNNLSISIDTTGYGETVLTTSTLDQKTDLNTLYNLFTNVQSVNVTLKDPDNWYSQKKMPIYSVTARWEDDTSFYGGQKIIIRVVTNKTNNAHTITGSYTILGTTQHINI